MVSERGRLPNIPTPLQGADAVLDAAAEIIQLPGRVIARLAGGVQEAATSFNAGVARPTGGSAPATPDVVISGAIQSVTGVVNGALGTVTGVIQAVVSTGEGVRREFEGLVPK